MKLSVVLILTDLNNKNPELDIGVNAERSVKEPATSSYLYKILRQKRAELLSRRIFRLNGQDPVSENPKTE